MKILLTLSLIVNLVLVYFLFSKKEDKPALEKVIIETHKKSPPLPDSSKKIPLNSVKDIKSESLASKLKDKDQEVGPELYDGADFQDSGERIERDKEEFLTQKLGLSEEKIQAYHKLRDDYFKETSNFWSKGPLGELSIEQRRKLLDREEKLHKDLEKLYGKDNWESYRKFREEYNQRVFKMQQEEQRPLLFMGI